MPTIVELGQKVKAKYPDAYGSMDDAVVGRLVKQKYPNAYQEFAEVPETDPRTAVAKTPIPIMAGAPFQMSVSPEQTLNALPGLASQAATEFPPAIPLAAAGGTMVRNAIAPHLGLEQQDPAMNGAMAGALAIPGEALQTFGPQIAGKLMQTALGSWGNRVARAAQTALRERIGPGFRWNKPVAQLDKLIDEGNALSKRLLEAADNNGLRINPNDMVKGPRMNDLFSDPAYTADEVSQFAKWNDELLTHKSLTKAGSPVQPIPQRMTSVDRMRERYANEAAGKFAAAAEREYSGPAKGLRQIWSKALAQDLRDLTHGALPPQFAEVEGRLSDLINLKSTLRPVAKSQATAGLRTRLGAAGIGAGAGYLAAAAGHQDYPHRLGAAAAGAVAASPPGLSNAALLMNNPLLAQMLTRTLLMAPAAVDATQR